MQPKTDLLYKVRFSLRVGMELGLLDIHQSPVYSSAVQPPNAFATRMRLTLCVKRIWNRSYKTCQVEQFDHYDGLHLMVCAIQSTKM